MKITIAAKTTIAAVGLAAGAVLAAPMPASAESTYWQDRAEGRGYIDPQAYRAPRYERRRDHVDIRIRKGSRHYVRRDRAYPPPRSYNGPVYQSQEQVQQSVYDFATGGVGDINAYR